MKTTAKKVVSLLLAMLLLFGVVGCAPSDTPSTTPSGTSGEGGNEGGDEGSLPDVTLTLYMNESALTTGGIQTDPIAQQIKEATGVTLDITIQDTDKTNAIVASGDLYDITILSNTEFIAPLIATGAIRPMDDFLQYAPELTENFSHMLEYCRQYLGDGSGKLYTLTMRPGTLDAEPAVTYGDHNGVFIRWDYYEEVGCPQPASYEEFLDMLEQIQKNHPTTADGKPVYALAQFIDWGAYGVTEYGVISKPQGILPFGDLHSYGLKDMEFYDLYNDNNLWWQSARVNWEANQRGLFDPESFTQTHDIIAQKLAEGRLIVSPVRWECKNLPLEDDQTFIDVPFADIPEFSENTKDIAPFGYTQRMVFLSSSMDDTKMEAAMRLINWLYSEEGSRTIMIGPKDVTWTIGEDGIAKFTDEAIEGLANSVNNSYEDANNMYKYINIVGRDYGALDSTGHPLDLRNEPDYVKQSLTQGEKEYCEYFGVDVPAEVMGMRENYTVRNRGIESLTPTDVPTNISRIATEVTNYMMQELPKLVMECATEDDFNAKVAEMRDAIKAMGYDEVAAYYSDAFDFAVTEYNKIANQ